MRGREQRGTSTPVVCEGGAGEEKVAGRKRRASEGKPEKGK